MSDNEKAKAIERANSYRDMCNLWAWKDLVRIIEEEKIASVTRCDSIPTKEMSLSLVSEERGIRKGLNKILSEVGYILQYK